jgi:hypothetical protein
MQKLPALLQSPQFKLKLFVWLVFLTLALVSATASIASLICRDILFLHVEGIAMPKITQIMLVFDERGLIWVLLLPWFAYALLAGLRSKLDTESCLVFAATAALMSAMLLLATVVAVLQPFMLLQLKSP